ncbi:MAG: dihydroneopterin aldolase [Paludibacteraceae bacterium]|nr:dihydroneopterin aldolase [Paludibacteraceae bacterium]
MIIRLEDIQFKAYHGVYPEEREQGNIFLVNVSLTLPDNRALETDRLEDTVDYQRVYQVVKHEMEQPSQLLEHVAGRIRQQLTVLCPTAEVHIQIKKKNPPLGGKVAWATVEL